MVIQYKYFESVFWCYTVQCMPNFHLRLNTQKLVTIILSQLNNLGFEINKNYMSFTVEHDWIQERGNARPNRLNFIISSQVPQIHSMFIVKEIYSKVSRAKSSRFKLCVNCHNAVFDILHKIRQHHFSSVSLFTTQSILQQHQIKKMLIHLDPCLSTPMHASSLKRW